jgi:Lysyl oxidase
MKLRKAAAGLGLLAVAACGGKHPTAEPRELLPDLDQAPPAAISVVEQDGRERLVFLSAVENAGPGPVLVSASRPNAERPEMSATQLIRREDGSVASRPLEARLRFVVSETHRHWHLLGFERYELRTPGGEPVGRDRKTGFCLGDRYDAHAGSRISGEPPRAVWTQECGRGQRERLRIDEGISPGFGDDYVPLLEGQYVDVTGLPPGRYVLVHRVNADRDIREASYANNASSALVVLRRDGGGNAAIRTLRTCPDTASCG